MAVGTTPRNPYTVGGPVRGAHFYGRTALIQSILDGNDRAIQRVAKVLVPAIGRRQAALLDVGQEKRNPAVPDARGDGGDSAGQERAVGADRGQESAGVMEVVNRQTELFAVVQAGRARGRLADLLDGRQQQADEHGDDRNDHEQLDECEKIGRASCRERV